MPRRNDTGQGLRHINIARGPILDEATLIAALDDGRLSRAMLDVAYLEPLPSRHPFYRRQCITLSPHVLFDTTHTEAALIGTFVGNLAPFSER